MALKLPIPGLDGRKLAATAARLRAWWDGQEFDAAALVAEPEGGPIDDAELFAEPEIPEDPRLAALQRIWGRGRLCPGDDAQDARMTAQAIETATGRLAVLGPGLAGPMHNLGRAHPGPIDVFEWRDEVVEALSDGVARIKLAARAKIHKIDLELFNPAEHAFDALVSFDDFTYASDGARFFTHVAKGLKPEGKAVLEGYCAIPSRDFSAAFATSFAEPQLRPNGDLREMMEGAGLAILREEECSEEHFALVRAGFRRLSEGLAKASLPPGVARELAWEAEAWRVRVRMLTQRRLERRRFLVQRK
jgi:hypothetical protein